VPRDLKDIQVNDLKKSIPVFGQILLDWKISVSNSQQKISTDSFRVFSFWLKINRTHTKKVSEFIFMLFETKISSYSQVYMHLKQGAWIC
jgi:hypothetical protein